MKIAPAILAASFLSLYCTCAAMADWGNVDKINKWFDDQKGRQYTIEGTKELQKAGPMQKAGEIQIPRGWDAVKVTKTDCKHRLTLCADTLFEFDKATLSQDAEATLRLVGPKIVELGEHPVRIEGHTDGKGTDEYNQNLSERRAERVKNWLMSNHYIPVASNIEGFGKKRPIAPNVKPDGSDDPNGRQKNRRVEIIVDTCTALNVEPQSSPAISTTSDTATKSPAWVVDDSNVLPFEHVFSPEQIKSQFTNAKVTPLGDDKLYFELLIPNDWQSKPLIVTKEQLAADRQTQIPLAELGPTATKDVLTEVRYMRVDDSVTPEQYLLAYATKSGFEIIKRQHAEFNERKAEDALMKLNTKDFGTVFTRLTVSKRGEYLFIIASSAPAAEYDKWKNIFAAAALSFDPKGK